jgi:hypothetical protein
VNESRLDYRRSAPAAANADVIRARLQRETAQAWLALALAQKSLRSVQTLISETSRQIDVQKAGVSSASASPGSVLDVQLALNAMKNEQDNARRDVQIAQARLLQHRQRGPRYLRPAAAH